MDEQLPGVVTINFGGIFEISGELLEEASHHENGQGEVNRAVGNDEGEIVVAESQGLDDF